MTAMFDYISGKKRGKVAKLEAELEHLDAHTVSAGEYDRIRDALKECMKYVPAHVEERYRDLITD